MAADNPEDRNAQRRGKANSRSGPRGPKPITQERLEKAALAYLERFASSAENLRRVLYRRIDRAARVHADTDVTAARDWADAIVARCQASGLVDDRAYAEGRVAAMRRAGQSERAIRAKLAEKGVAEDIVESALAAHRGETGTGDLAAAVAYVRRRRIGPYRRPDQRAATRERDLAALGRRGFAPDTAKAVIDSQDPETLLTEAGDDP